MTASQPYSTRLLRIALLRLGNRTAFSMTRINSIICIEFEAQKLWNKKFLEKYIVLTYKLQEANFYNDYTLQ